MEQKTSFVEYIKKINDDVENYLSSDNLNNSIKLSKFQDNKGPTKPKLALSTFASNKSPADIIAIYNDEVEEIEFIRTKIENIIANK
jgi:hypothetical protein